MTPREYDAWQDLSTCVEKIGRLLVSTPRSFANKPSGAALNVHPSPEIVAVALGAVRRARSG
jgi:hypothetical protein